MGLKNRKAIDAQKPVSLAQPEPVVVTVTHSPANTANKPFAALGKVIG
jgi:hypothetical protein